MAYQIDKFARGRVDGYRATARKALAEGNRQRFIAMRRAECHVLLEQAKRLPKRITLPEHVIEDSPFGPIRPTVINEARLDLIARICERTHRLARMDNRARGALCEIVDRCDGFYDVMQMVPGSPSVPATSKLASRAAAEEWAQWAGYTIKAIA